MSDKKIEVRRSFVFEPQKRDAAAVDAKPVIEGHAAVFNSVTELWPGFFEVIEPGAFKRTIAEDDIACLWNHNWDRPLGRKSANTLTLQEDIKGLLMVCEPPSHEAGVIESIQRGDVPGMSFGFYIEDYKMTTQDDGSLLRTVLTATVTEVSPCVRPAYTDTDVAVRSEFTGAEFDVEAMAGAVMRSRSGDVTASDKALFAQSLTLLRSRHGVPTPDSMVRVLGYLDVLQTEVDLRKRRWQ